MAFVEDQGRLLTRTFTLLWFRNRRDKFGCAAVRQDILSWLTLIIELPVALGVAVRGIQDWMVEKWIAVVHALQRSSLPIY